MPAAPAFPSIEPHERGAQVDAHLGPVREIGVFRALGLGDLLCATPAWRALRHRFPHARITLISLPWAAELAERLETIDAFEAFPGHPLLPERKPDAEAWPAFVDAMRARRFDLLLQMHGSGRVTNGLVSAWGARHVAAFHEADLPSPDALLGVRWPTHGPEARRLMQLVDGLGAPASVDAAMPVHDEFARWRLDFPLRPDDVTAARALLARHGLACDDERTPRQSLVCVHAGSQLPSRRWPISRFVDVARALAEQGHVIALTGVASEQELGRALQAALPAAHCINLVGQTNLWTLGALIQSARLLVCNDTGVSHVAAALGTPSVVISCGSDVSRWAPADTSRHRVLWSDQPCRPCGYRDCPTAHECAWDIGPASVLDAAQTQLAARA